MKTITITMLIMMAGAAYLVPASRPAQGGTCTTDSDCEMHEEQGTLGQHIDGDDEDEARAIAATPQPKPPKAPAGLTSKAAQCAYREGWSAARKGATDPLAGMPTWIRVEDSDCEAWGAKAEASAAKSAAKAKARKIAKLRAELDKLAK